MNFQKKKSFDVKEFEGSFFFSSYPHDIERADIKQQQKQCSFGNHMDRRNKKSCLQCYNKAKIKYKKMIFVTSVFPPPSFH